MRKASKFFLLLFFGTLFALIIASVLSRPASAKVCYNGQNQVVPCPNYQNPTKPSPPTQTPTDTPADTATPLACVPVTGQGDAGQTPTEGNTSFLFSPWILGGGGILIGLLIGLLIGGVIGPSMNRRGIIAPTDSPAGGIIAPTDGFDGITERDVPERPPGSPRPEPQPRATGSLLDDSSGPLSTKIGPKHDDPSPPPPDSPDVDDGDTSTDLDLDVHLDVPD